MNKILTFARKNSIPAQVVTTSAGLQAVSIPADLPGVADLLAGFCRRSGGRYTMEHRNQADGSVDGYSGFLYLSVFV